VGDDPPREDHEHRVGVGDDPPRDTGARERGPDADETLCWPVRR
jgi:hypothetical protein